MRLPSLIALLATAAPLPAQQQLPRLPTSFYCFGYAAGLQDVFVRSGAEAFQKIELSTANMVGPLAAVVADGAITVHRKETDAEGKDSYPPVGSARIGAVRKPLLVLFPAPRDEPLPYRMLTLDRSDARFPLGSYQFINLSPHPMRGLVGQTRLDAKPGSVNNLKPKGTPGEVVNVVFEYHDGTLWRPMTQTRWAIRDDRRSLICAYLDPRDKRVKMRAIPERLVPPAETR
jgi:hypothetical protein